MLYNLPPMKPTVILFDVDGVLVHPGGYRAAVQAAVNYFTSQMGLGNLAPDVDTIAVFEAQGITCEWDMVPLLLAMIIEEASLQSDMPGRIDSVEEAVQWLSRVPDRELIIDYPTRIRALKPFVQTGVAPADSIMQACLGRENGAPFTRLARYSLLRELLSFTRRPGQSLTTQIFTTFSLGHEVYQQAMRLQPLFESESLLHKHDLPLLTEQIRDGLNATQQRGEIHMAAYTARPSLPDDPAQEVLAVFAPEAEMAVAQVGLEGIVIVGSGQTGEAAWQLGENEDRLTKPAPYHALAAAAAALTGSRQLAMSWAKAVFLHFERGEAAPALKIGGTALPSSLTLHIFEDSPSGIQGGITAADMLAHLGIDVDLHLWGVTTHPDKTAALKAVGAQVWADVNQAVAAAGVLQAAAKDGR
jgi:hypothetical protein